MEKMFYNCDSLTSLNISNWNTSNVTNMASMFDGCSSLTFDNIIMTGCSEETINKIKTQYDSDMI
jgi:surface protein